MASMVQLIIPETDSNVLEELDFLEVKDVYGDGTLLCEWSVSM